MAEITLALGGGGTRGAAHIGVLRVLKRVGCHIRGISGTSIGSIIAALFAAGYSPDLIEERVASIDFTRLDGRLLSDGPGLLGISGVQKWLEKQLGSRTFETRRRISVSPCPASPARRRPLTAICLTVPFP